MDIADDADDGEQAHVAIHVSEFNGVADRVLTGPGGAGQRVADKGDVGRVGGVVGVEDTTAKQGNAESAEISIGDDAEVGAPPPLLLLQQDVKFAS